MMFKKFGGALKRLGRKAKIAASFMSVAVVTAITTVIASAEEAAGGSTTVSSTMDFNSIVSSAGSTLEKCLTNLATALAPTLITVAVSGLGMYAVTMLFSLAKKLFSKAAG